MDIHTVCSVELVKADGSYDGTLEIRRVGTHRGRLNDGLLIRFSPTHECVCSRSELMAALEVLSSDD